MGTAKLVAGNEVVRTVVAFLTIDLAVPRAGGRLVSIGADVQYGPDTEDGSGPPRADGCF